MTATYVQCEFCNDTTKFRIIYGPNKYERYACDQHQTKLRQLAAIDGYTEDDYTASHSLAGPYTFNDIAFKNRSKP